MDYFDSDIDIMSLLLIAIKLVRMIHYVMRHYLSIYITLTNNKKDNYEIHNNELEHWRDNSSLNMEAKSEAICKIIMFH